METGGMRSPLRHGLVERERLALIVVRKLRLALVQELHAAAVEERSITSHRHRTAQPS
jgi:hypothetical protein